MSGPRWLTYSSVVRADLLDHERGNNDQLPDPSLILKVVNAGAQNTRLPQGKSQEDPPRK